MAARNLNFECVCMVQTLPAFAKIAAAFPQMQLVLPHLGNPRAEVLHPWRREMRNLAQFQNVSVKITGWGAVNRAYDLDTFRPFVEDTLSIFGVDRCIYGTNMPVDKQFRSFESQIDKFEELLGCMKADERDRLFRTNAQRIYRFQQSRRYVP